MTGVSEQESGDKPLAIIHGKSLSERPADLYIPAHPLEVSLDNFEGPLDLLLYLIKKQKLDIIDLPIAEITVQYLHFVEQAKSYDIELAAEYLIMAAKLAEIKSRMLLPKALPEEEEVDPRAELAKRLQEYQKFKLAAEQLAELPRIEREYYQAGTSLPDNFEPLVKYTDIELSELVSALSDVLQKSKAYEHHHVHKEALSTDDKIQLIMARLRELPDKTNITLNELFEPSEGKSGVVVTFLALLELLKSGDINCQQTNTKQPIQLSLAL